MDSKKLLTCKICSREIRRLDTHIKPKHGITVEAYRQQFPDAIMSLSSSDSMKTLHSEIGDKLVGALQRGLRDRWERPESLKHQSDVASLWWKDPENYAIGREANRVKKVNHWNNDGDNLARKIVHAQKRFRIDYTDRKGQIIQLKSTWEVRMALLLDACGMDWEYEATLLRYTDAQGKARRYFPDFRIAEFDCFVEVKGQVTDAVRYQLANLAKQGYQIILADRALMQRFNLLGIKIPKDSVIYSTLISSQALQVIARKVQRLTRTILRKLDDEATRARSTA